MVSVLEVKKIEVEAAAGCSIHEAAREAMEIASSHSAVVEFDFNGVLCRAHPGHSAENLVSAYDHVLDARRKASEMVAESSPPGTP